VEVIGILSGRRDSGYLNFFNPILPRFAGDGPEYHGAYGYRLRVHNGIDQLKRASDALTANPQSRQVVLQLWDGALDLPSPDGQPAAADIPCNICSMLKVRNGKLEWSQIMRSNDLFKGLPYNFVQFTTLQEVVAGWIGAEPGTYTHYSDSLHLYQEDKAGAFSSQAIPMVASNDSIALPKADSDPIWQEMNRRVDLLVTKDLSANDYRHLARIHDAPQAFNNLLAVVTADAARRKRCFEGINAAISSCQSTLLLQLWSRWTERNAQRERRSGESPLESVVDMPERE
jgi:thymidylate synthase